MILSDEQQAIFQHPQDENAYIVCFPVCLEYIGGINCFAAGCLFSRMNDFCHSNDLCMHPCCLSLGFLNKSKFNSFM